ncbi:hypothetical protein ACFL2D_00330 [Patescibacteria group bacterium]
MITKFLSLGIAGVLGIFAFAMVASAAIPNNGSVTAIKIAKNAVTSVKIGDNVIKRRHIAANSIRSNKIADGQVKTQDLANMAVTGDKLADETITSDKIKNGMITANDLGLNSVAKSEIASGAVENEELADNAVTTEKVLNGTILGEDLDNGAVLEANMSDDSVRGGPGGVIVDESITTEDIDDGTIRGEDITPWSIEGSAGSGMHIATQSITGDNGPQFTGQGDITPNSIVGSGGMDTGHQLSDIKTRSIAGNSGPAGGDSGDIAEGTIDSVDITNGSIHGNDLQASTLNGNHIQENSLQIALLSLEARLNAVSVNVGDLPACQELPCETVVPLFGGHPFGYMIFSITYTDALGIPSIAGNLYDNAIFFELIEWESGLEQPPTNTRTLLISDLSSHPVDPLEPSMSFIEQQVTSIDDLVVLRKKETTQGFDMNKFMVTIFYAGGYPPIN